MCQQRNEVEEPLAAIERGISFDLPEGLLVRCASVMPSAGDLCQVLGRVLDIDEGQAYGGE